MANKKNRRVPDDTDRLYKAVQHYVEKRGGKLIVIGGVEIQKWPTDGEFVFRLAIKCMGKQPQKDEKDAKSSTEVA